MLHKLSYWHFSEIKMADEELATLLSRASPDDVKALVNARVAKITWESNARVAKIYASIHRENTRVAIELYPNSVSDQDAFIKRIESRLSALECKVFR